MKRPLFTIVAPITVRHDAISASVRHTFQMVGRRGDWDVALLTLKNEFDDLPAHVVHDVTDVLRASSYMNADVLFYSFGVYNPLFDCMTIGNGRAMQIARFHNITPAGLLPPGAASLIEKSFVQLNNLRNCDWIWADSQFNADVLYDLGFDRRKIEVIPLVVEGPALSRMSAKSAERLHFVFVGRAVKSKGLLDCIEAVANFARRDIPFKLSIAGNLNFADTAYLAHCHALIEENGLQQSIEMLGTVGDSELSELYASAHLLLIPSYHEGFCVPVVEALRAGSVPIGYSAGNLPYIANGFGRLVAPGDTGALSSAIFEVARSIYAGRSAPLSTRLPLDRGWVSVEEFTVQVEEYVAGFAAQKVAAMTMARIDGLDPMRRSAAVRSMTAP